MTDAALPLRVLVIGGTGVFGDRLVTGLLQGTGFDIVVAGRDKARLAACIDRRNGPIRPGERTRVTVLTLDRRRVTPGDLRTTGAFAVVDAAGPYQACDHRLAGAAIAAGLHYLDLADGRAFVAAFGALDAAAKAAGVVALTGVSTTPALSNAVLDRLTAGWRHVDRVEIAISPGNRAPRGLSVVRAILSYAGQPVRIFADGRWCERRGWGMTVRRTIPGLGPRWFSLAETPDLDIVPHRFAVRRTVMVRAGLELQVLHLGLLAASLLVRWRIMASLAPLARLFRGLAALVVRLGTDRGGMAVEVAGLDLDGCDMRGVWSLVAEQGEGPFVPILPMLAALRALADGRLADPGASACVGKLSLAEIEKEFSSYRIASRMSVEPLGPSLYQRVLGASFGQLPEPLRRLHQPGWGLSAFGMARVDGADTRLARLISTVFNFPPAAGEVPVSIGITSVRGRELWLRDFGGKRFASRLEASARPGRLIERFGPLSFELAVEVGPGGVRGMPVLAWRLGPLPLPKLFIPVSIATEGVDQQGRFCFDVEMRLPLGLGRIVRYRGWLVPRIDAAPTGG